MLLTDPQVHSRGSHERFGRGDLGDQGIRAFFQHHRCNAWCKNFGLRSEHDVCDPTHTLQIPGVASCLAELGGPEFFADLKRRCRASTVLVPQEAYADWQEIKIWATRKGGQRALEQVQERLEAFYSSHRIKELPPPTCRWSAHQWEQQLQAWQTESGARVLAWPPGWRSDGVQELWVFDGDGEAARSSKAYAMKRIRAKFEEEGVVAGEVDDARREAHVDPGAAAPGVDSATVAAGPVAPTWSKYQDYQGNMYWYREPDGKWFYERDRKWSRFFDDVLRAHWWWETDTGDWFYEPHRGQ